eukprot:g23671.t1
MLRESSRKRGSKGSSVLCLELPGELDSIIPDSAKVKSASKSASAGEEGSSSPSEEDDHFGSEEVPEHSSSKVNHLKSSRKRILVRCRRVSLEELRDNHDSELVNYKSANERHNGHNTANTTDLNRMSPGSTEGRS